MKKNEKLVTIIIPIYNVKDYLKSCVDSVCNQTYHNLEIILVDDGSTDGTTDLCEQLEKKDARITLIKQKNKGVSAARNRGIKAAHGEYIYFVDSDDWIEHNTIEECLNIMIKEKLDICMFDGYIEQETEEKFFASDMYIRKKIDKEVYSGKKMFCYLSELDEYRVQLGMFVLRNKLLQHYNINFYEGIIHEDNLFVFLLMMYAKRVKHIDKVFYHRRVRDNSIVTTKKSMRNFRGYQIVMTEMDKFCRDTKMKDMECRYYLNRICHTWTVMLLDYLLVEQWSEVLKYWLDVVGLARVSARNHFWGDKKIKKYIIFMPVWYLYGKMRRKFSFEKE